MLTVTITPHQDDSRRSRLPTLSTGVVASLAMTVVAVMVVQDNKSATHSTS